MTRAGADILRFTTTPADLATWRDDPAIALGAGDVVSFAAVSLAADTSQPCQDMVSSEAKNPLRFELTIADVQPDHLDLQISSIVYRPAGSAVFHPEACSGGFGAVAEVRAAGTQPWLVLEAKPGDLEAARLSVNGRVAEGGKFLVHQQRFDYPRSTYDPGDPTSIPPKLPQAASANDVAFSFQLSGPIPITPGTGFIWNIGSGYLPVAYSDVNATAGLATVVYPYSSRRLPSLVFTSLTGSNEVLQADPALVLSPTAAGVVGYH